MGYQHVQGIGCDGELLWGVGYELAVHINRQMGLGLYDHPRGLVVGDALALHEVPALEIPGDSHEIPVPPKLYRVDVEGAVVYARTGRHDHAAAVEPAVPNGDL